MNLVRASEQGILRRIFASLFLPFYRPQPPQSIFEGYAEQERLERPLRPTAQTRWLQQDVEHAIILADSGDLSKAARLVASLRRDGTYSGLMSTRAGGLIRLPRIFRGTPSVVADLEGSDDIGLFDRVHPAKELEQFTSDGITLGVAVAEYLPVPGRDEPIFVRLNPEFLRYVWSEDRWYFLSIAGRLPVTPGDGRWVLHTPGGYQEPWRGGLWPSLARAYVAKDHAGLYRENYNNKLANPARVAVAPAGASDQQKQTFWRRVMQWGINTVFGLPPGWDIRLLESNGRGFEVFSQTIKDADREIMIDISGQIVTIDGGAGFANADIHATIRSDLIQGDGLGVATTINSQGLRPLINRLYGRGARGLIAWDTRAPVDLKTEGEALSACAKAIQDIDNALRSRGQCSDVSEILTRFRVPTIPLDITVNRSEMDDAQADDAAEKLAAKMTEYALARCEHGSSNRCRLCGIERIRDFETAPDGSHNWKILWRPINNKLSPQPPELRLLQGGLAA